MKMYKNGFTLRNAILSIAVFGVVATTVPIAVQNLEFNNKTRILESSSNKLLSNLYKRYLYSNVAYAGPCMECADGSTVCSEWGDIAPSCEPLVLDLDGDGVIEISDFEGGRYFDYDGNGFAKRTTWSTKGDGVLAVDYDGNGKIDSEKELVHSEDMFAFDKNDDKVINKADEIFSKLRIIKNDGSLKTLDEEGISEIVLFDNWDESTDAKGNFKFAEGTFKKVDGKAYRYHAYYFQVSPFDTQELDVVKVSIEVNKLPNIKNYGTVRSLHQAMMRDAELKKLVEQFTKEQNDITRERLTEEILAKWTGADKAEASERTKNIDPKHLAVVEKFFKMSDKKLWEVQRAEVRFEDINKQSAEALESIYLSLENMVYGELMSQSHLSDLTKVIKKRQDGSSDLSEVTKKLAKEVSQNPKTGRERVLQFAKMVKGVGLDKTSNYLDPKDADSFYLKFTENDRDLKWQIDSSFKPKYELTEGRKSEVNNRKEIIGTEGADAYNSKNYDAKETDGYLIHMMDGDDVIYGSESRGEALIGCNGDDVIDGGAGSNIIAGNDGNDILFGGSGVDKIQGGDGDDIIFGGDGDDLIYPDADDETVKPAGTVHIGNDIIVGGRGNDVIYSVVGDDTFIFNLGDGVDTIYEEEGNDTLYFGKGITWNDLVFERVGLDMMISIKSSTDAIIVKNWFAEGQVGSKNKIIENFEFSNGKKYTNADIKMKK